MKFLFPFTVLDIKIWFPDYIGSSSLMFSMEPIYLPLWVRSLGEEHEALAVVIYAGGQLEVIAQTLHRPDGVQLGVHHPVEVLDPRERDRASVLLPAHILEFDLVQEIPDKKKKSE